MHVYKYTYLYILEVLLLFHAFLASRIWRFLILQLFQAFMRFWVRMTPAVEMKDSNSEEPPYEKKLSVSVPSLSLSFSIAIRFRCASCHFSFIHLSMQNQKRRRLNGDKKRSRHPHHCSHRGAPLRFPWKAEPG